VCQTLNSPPLQTLGTKPIAHIDHFTPEMLGTAELAEEVSLDGSGKLIKVGVLGPAVLRSVGCVASNSSCKCLPLLLFFFTDHRLRQPREDGVHRGPRLQQAGDRGGGALHPRRAVRHPLPGQEEVGHFFNSFFEM